jgi:hypothetical protein
VTFSMPARCPWSTRPKPSGIFCNTVRALPVVFDDEFSVELCSAMRQGT